MKLFRGLFWTLILATVIAQFGSSYVLPSRIQVDENEGLLTDSRKEVGNETDIIIAQPGLLDVILENGELIFGVPEQQCNGEFFACYEADPPGQNVTSFISDSCDTKCGFYVSGRDIKITYMKPFEGRYTGRDKKYEYAEMTMRNGTTGLNDAQEVRIPSCSPKVENGMVKLNIVNTSSECPVIIKSAMLKNEPTTPPSTSLGTTVGPNIVPGAAGAATTESSSSIGDYWYLFLIVGVFLAAIFVGTGVICFIKRRRSSKKAAAAPRRKLRGSQSPIVARPSNESHPQTPSHEAAAPPSYLSPSSIFSHKSMLLSKKEAEPEKGNEKAAVEAKEPEETDLTSVKPTA